MKKNLSEVVMILDRSGSMAGLESDTIGGYNAFVNKQKKEEGEAYLTTVLFDSNAETLHDRVPLEEVRPITEKEYYVRGCTALLDAMGDTIRKIGDIHKYAREEDVPERTVFVIITDGYENSSKRYSAKEVKRMVERQKEKYGWEFLFLGANMDAVETAAQYGIRADRAASFHNDAKGIATNFESVSYAVGSIRRRASAENWKDQIDQDYNSRKFSK